MPDRVRWEQLVSGAAEPSPLERAGLAGLSVASVVYRGASAVHRAMSGRNAWQPPVPTVCVGNITLGGTGKTTVSRHIARKLMARGMRVAVVLRGYGRAGEMSQRVAHDGTKLLASPEQVGDEAVMLGESLESAVVLVGSSRVESARHAVEEFQADAIVLDDGLQHWRVRPHLTIALWDATHTPLRARLFPRGRLREPLSSLPRFDLLALTRCDSADDPEEILRQLRYHSGDRPIVQCVHEPAAVVGSSGEASAPDTLCGTRVFAASSLGNPRAFRSTLESVGAEVVGECVFPDHHLYTPDDVGTIRAGARTCGADLILATEKDMVKLRRLPGHEEIRALTVDISVVGSVSAEATPFDSAIDQLVGENIGD